MSRVQACDSVRLAPPQRPAEQVYVVQRRVWVPLSSQVVENPLQRPQRSQTVPGRQESPSVEARLHAAVSVRVLSPQAPRAQTASVHVRLCVPVVVHSSAKAHAVNAPQTVAPHEAPSVMREQARLSGVLVMLHAPPAQA